MIAVPQDDLEAVCTVALHLYARVYAANLVEKEEELRRANGWGAYLVGAWTTVLSWVYPPEEEKHEEKKVEEKKVDSKIIINVVKSDERKVKLFSIRLFSIGYFQF
jgi:hypothetical protein